MKGKETLMCGCKMSREDHEWFSGFEADWDNLIYAWSRDLSQEVRFELKEWIKNHRKQFYEEVLQK